MDNNVKRHTNRSMVKIVIGLCLLFPFALGWQILWNPSFLYAYGQTENLNALFAQGYFAHVFNGGMLDTEFIPIQNVNLLAMAILYTADFIPINKIILLWLGQSVLACFFFVQLMRFSKRWLGPDDSLFTIVLVGVHPLVWISLFWMPSQVLLVVLLLETIVRLSKDEGGDTGCFYALLLLSFGGVMGFLCSLILVPVSFLIRFNSQQSLQDWFFSVIRSHALSLAALVPAFTIYTVLSVQWQMPGGPRLAEFETLFSYVSLHKLLSGEWTVNAKEVLSRLGTGWLDIPYYLPFCGFMALAGLQTGKRELPGTRRLRIVTIALSCFMALILSFVPADHAWIWILPLLVLLDSSAIRGIRSIADHFSHYARTVMEVGICSLILLSLAAFAKPWDVATSRASYYQHVCSSLKQVLETSPNLVSQEIAFQFSIPVVLQFPRLRDAFPIGLYVLGRYETVCAKRGGLRLDLRMAPAPQLVVLYPRFGEILDEEGVDVNSSLPESVGSVLAHYTRSRIYNLDVYTRESASKTVLFHGWLRSLFEEGNDFDPEILRPFYTLVRFDEPVKVDTPQRRYVEKMTFPSDFDPVTPLVSIATESRRQLTGRGWDFETDNQQIEQIGTAFSFVPDSVSGGVGGYHVSSGNSITRNNLGILESEPFTIEGDDLTAIASFPKDSTSTFFCLAVYQQAPNRGDVRHVFDHQPGEVLMGDTFFYIKPSHLVYLPGDTVQGWRVVRLMHENQLSGWQKIEWPIEAWKNQQAVWMAADRDRNGVIRIDQIAQWKRPAILRWNFENGSYAGWQVLGTAFGPAPAFGPYGNQTAIDGYEGNFFINSYWDGSDEATGTLTSPAFTVRGDWIEFSIGGGEDLERTYVVLIVDGQIVLRETGKHSETLRRVRWDIRPWVGKQARLRIADLSRRPWGHILVDDIHISQIRSP